MIAVENSPLIAGAGDLWQAATQAPFLDAAANGSLPASAFERWLAQDYAFVKGLTTFQGILAAKTPRGPQKPVIAGLAALDAEVDWFEAKAAEHGLPLNVSIHPTCRRYVDYLISAAYTQPYQVGLAILFGVEAAYLGSWATHKAEGPYAEYIERWSNPAFAAYVDELSEWTQRCPHPAQRHEFQLVLRHERDFWRMTWEG